MQAATSGLAKTGLAKMHRAWRHGTTVVTWEEGRLCRRKVSDYAFGEQYLHAGTGEGPARDTRWSEDTDVSVKHELTLTDKVEVPVTITVDATAKSSAVTAIAAAPAVVIPTASGTTIDASAPIVEAFKSYAYVRTAGTCPSAACSAACDAEELNVPDVYACQEDGASVAEASCVSAGIGAAPSSETTCCPAADEDTCEQSAAEVTAPPAPPPIFDCADSTLTSQEVLDCLEDETGLSGGAIAGIVVGGLVAVIGGVYCICCRGGEEEASKAPAGDVEAGGDDTERREVLEKRLAHVRNQIPEEQKP
jgi:hypothetical protein